MKIEAENNVSTVSARVANLRPGPLVLNWSHANGLWDGTFNVLLLSEVRTVDEQFYFFL